MERSMSAPPPLTLAPFSLALWATNLATPLNGLEAWAAHVEAKLAEAAAAGAKLLVMPEYACEAWLSFKPARSEEHTSELQSLMRISYAVFCLKKKKKRNQNHIPKSNEDDRHMSKNKLYNS